MINLINKTNAPIDLERLSEIAATLTEQTIELILVNDEEMVALNSTHRGKRSTTDVLSFPLEQSEGMPFIPLGSIVICVDVARRVSEEHAHTLNDEFALLFIHGLLHLLGYDHEQDNGEHRAREREIIEDFYLPHSLILRSEGSAVAG